MKSYRGVAEAYRSDVISGRVIIGEDAVNACKRFVADLARDDLEMRSHDADFVIELIQKTIVHRQGEDIQGNSLVGKPFILEPWQIFIIYNLLGFYYKGTDERRYKEAFIVMGRKNGKTSFVASLRWAVSILQSSSGSKCYIVANSQTQSLEAFNFLKYSLEHRGLDKGFKINNSEKLYAIRGEIGKGNTLEIRAMASNPKAHDSFNCNFCIADEVGAYKSPAQYNRFKEAMKAYTNKLMVGITTAGDEINSFGYRRTDYRCKVANGTVKDDTLFSFVCRADEDENGNIDYTNPIQHQKANPNYNVTIRPEDILNESLQAQNDPQQRKDFLSRSLNRYTSSMRSYFNLVEFQTSDAKYDWTVDQLAKLGINWYGGADLSKMHDLTARALYGSYQGVDIIITHRFCPVVMARQKSEEDNIPLFGWEEDGWLTMSNSPTVNYADVVKWFGEMRAKGFNIRQVGHDRKFSREYVMLMQKEGFSVIDQPQYFYKKSEGFRHIEKRRKDGNLYYLHSTAYEYCVENVRAVEKTDRMVDYSKIGATDRIDLFDASVFACVRYLEEMENSDSIKSWFGIKDKTNGIK